MRTPAGAVWQDCQVLRQVVTMVLTRWRERAGRQALLAVHADGEYPPGG